MRSRLHPWRPAPYHGTETVRPYFEGWYFKFVPNSKACPVAFIPGIFRGICKEQDIGFIQVLYGKNDESRFIRYPPDAFSCPKDAFRLRIGNSSFSLDEVHVDIEDNGFCARADLVCRDHRFLKTSLYSPSIMGPFSYLPGLQCSHGVLSLRHAAAGSLIIGGEAVDMDGATGYIEKDWGRAFPGNWVWLQGSGRSRAWGDADCMCAVASVCLGPLRFTGLIAVIAVGGAQYRFATYNGGRTAFLNAAENGVDIEVKKRGYRLALSARAAGRGRILAPTPTGMDRDVYETINATMSVTLLKRGRPLYSGVMDYCGMERSNAEALMKGAAPAP
ncbi:MAG: tocopherol cyclase family protein [Christensenellales bacterium]|jgi:tocopherol cyclase